MGKKPKKSEQSAEEKSKLILESIKDLKSRAYELIISGEQIKVALQNTQDAIRVRVLEYQRLEQERKNDHS